MEKLDLNIAEFSTEDILPLVSKNSKLKRIKSSINGLECNVRLNSRKLYVFKRNTKCCCCGICGEKFILSYNKKDEPFSLQLYATNSFGCRILLTQDHIRFKSAGGKDGLYNLRTMCDICNNIRSNKYEIFDDIINNIPVKLKRVNSPTYKKIHSTIVKFYSENNNTIFTYLKNKNNTGIVYKKICINNKFEYIKILVKKLQDDIFTDGRFYYRAKELYFNL